MAVKPVAFKQTIVLLGGSWFLDRVLGLLPVYGLSFLCHADLVPRTSPGLSEL